MAKEKEVVKDEKYYESRRLLGYRKVAAKRTRFQQIRSWEKAIRKVEREMKKPAYDGSGILWGKNEDRRSKN